MNDERLTDEALARLAAAIEPYGGYDGKVTLTVSDVVALLAEVERLTDEVDRWRIMYDEAQRHIKEMRRDMQQPTLNAAAPSQHNTIQP
jgi:hypothetical protein